MSEKFLHNWISGIFLIFLHVYDFSFLGFCGQWNCSFSFYYQIWKGITLKKMSYILKNYLKKNKHLLYQNWNSLCYLNKVRIINKGFLTVFTLKKSSMPIIVLFFNGGRGGGLTSPPQSLQKKIIFLCSLQEYLNQFYIARELTLDEDENVIFQRK